MGFWDGGVEGYFRDFENLTAGCDDVAVVLPWIGLRVVWCARGTINIQSTNRVWKFTLK